MQLIDFGCLGRLMNLNQFHHKYLIFVYERLGCTSNFEEADSDFEEEATAEPMECQLQETQSQESHGLIKTKHYLDSWSHQMRMTKASQPSHLVNREVNRAEMFHETPCQAKEYIDSMPCPPASDMKSKSLD